MLAPAAGPDFELTPAAGFAVSVSSFGLRADRRPLDARARCRSGRKSNPCLRGIPGYPAMTGIVGTRDPRCAVLPCPFREGLSLQAVGAELGISSNPAPAWEALARTLSALRLLKHSMRCVPDRFPVSFYQHYSHYVCYVFALVSMVIMCCCSVVIIVNCYVVSRFLTIYCH